jgi:hypothetical protein
MAELYRTPVDITVAEESSRVTLFTETFDIDKPE